MRWRTGRRALAAFFAAWFLVVEEEPAALHACAMHDGPAHAASSRSDRAPHAPAVDVAPTHHAGAVPGGPTRHDDSGRHSRCCTCLGPCCDASPVALIGTGVALAPVQGPRETAQIVRRNSYRPSEPEHARPPSLGPPAPHIG